MKTRMLHAGVDVRNSHKASALIRSCHGQIIVDTFEKDEMTAAVVLPICLTLALANAESGKAGKLSLTPRNTEILIPVAHSR